MKTLVLLSLAAASLATASPVTEALHKFQKLNPDARLRMLDAKYDEIGLLSFVQIVDRYTKMLKGAASKQHAGFDCDDYALLFKASVTLQSLQEGKNYACGILGVYQKNAFGGVRPVGNTKHMLNVIIRHGSLVIIEPQSLQTSNLYQYPNKKNVIELTF